MTSENNVEAKAEALFNEDRGIDPSDDYALYRDAYIGGNIIRLWEDVVQDSPRLAESYRQKARLSA